MGYCLRTYLFFLFSLILGGPLIGQSETLFEKATDAYNEGNYEDAIGFYEDILEQGEHSAALYFNLGNAHYKKNEIAPSIYYYEKALLLDPDDPEVKNNLVFARNMTLDAITPIPETDLERYYNKLVLALSIDGWAYLGIFFVMLFVGAYLFFLSSQTPNKKRIALFSSLVALMLAVGSTTISYLRYRAYQEDQPAIIYTREIQVRPEPNERSSPAFLLHEGTKVQVIDSLGEWAKIELADGQVGWIPEKSLRMLKDF
jgi:tetratricopeptide (TPR) repeat protein